MSELPSSCVLRGCDEPQFDYSLSGCSDPYERPELSALSATNPQNGIAFSATITLDSTLEWTFSIIHGSLPTGLALTTTGDAEATISGIPSVPGTFDFIIQAVNGWGTVTQQAYLLTVT